MSALGVLAGGVIALAGVVAGDFGSTRRGSGRVKAMSAALSESIELLGAGLNRECQERTAFATAAATDLERIERGLAEAREALAVRGLDIAELKEDQLRLLGKVEIALKEQDVQLKKLRPVELVTRLGVVEQNVAEVSRRLSEFLRDDVRKLVVDSEDRQRRLDKMAQAVDAIETRLDALKSGGDNSVRRLDEMAVAVKELNGRLDVRCDGLQYQAGELKEQVSAWCGQLQQMLSAQQAVIEQARAGVAAARMRAPDPMEALQQMQQQQAELQAQFAARARARAEASFQPLVQPRAEQL